MNANEESLKYDTKKHFEKPKISVIVPVYNVEKYLAECLDSLICQTLDELEFVCVDDNSTDNSFEILKKYAKSDSRFVIISQENQGPGIARNNAINMAKGEYLVFVDPDDWIEIDALEKIYKYFKKTNADVIQFNYKEYNEEKDRYREQDFQANLLSLYNYDISKTNAYNSVALAEKNLLSCGMAVWNKAYSTAYIKSNNIKFAPCKHGEDHIFTIMAVLNTENIYYLDDYLYFYRIRIGSIVNKASAENICVFENNKLIRGFLIQKGLFGTLEKSYREYIEELIRYHYCALPKEYQEIYKQKARKVLTKSEYSDFLTKIKNSNTLIENIFSIKKKRVYGIERKCITILGISFVLKEKRIYKNFSKKIQHIKQKIKNGKKIRVAFYINDSKWKCQNLFNLMEKSKIYEPFMVIGKNYCDNSHREFQTKKEILEIYNNFKKNKMTSFLAYNFKKNRHIPLENYKADIVFYSRPYCIDKICNISRVNKFALTCYVPYFIPNSPVDIEAGQNFHELLWKYYILNNDTKKEYSKVMTNRGKNLVAVGYPLLDSYLQNSTIKNNDYTIYAPHWSLGDTALKYSTFDWNGEYILKFAKKHPEIRWVFKPHPLLKAQLLETGIMQAEEIDNYWNEWRKIGIVYEGSDYLDLFKESKAMITDCGSFLAEYMPTGKPEILLRSNKATEYNFLAKKVTKFYYHAWNLDELEKTLQEVLIKNQDYQLEKRLDMLDKLQLLTNASQNIIDNLNKEFEIGAE